MRLITDGNFSWYILEQWTSYFKQYNGLWILAWITAFFPLYSSPFLEHPLFGK